MTPSRQVLGTSRTSDETRASGQKGSDLDGVWKGPAEEMTVKVKQCTWKSPGASPGGRGNSNSSQDQKEGQAVWWEGGLGKTWRVGGMGCAALGLSPKPSGSH